MKRLLILLALPIALGLAGCTRENSASIVPAGLCFPPAPTNGTCPGTATCQAFVAGTSQFFLGFNPAFPMASNGEFGFFAQYNNQLPDNADPSSGRTNTNGATVEESALSFSVHQSLSGAPAFAIPDQTVSTTSLLISTGGSGTAWMPILPNIIMGLLNSSIAPGDGVLVDVEVRAKGHLSDGSSFETGPLMVPVLVINALFPGFSCSATTQKVTAICPGSTGFPSTFTCG